MAIDPLYTRARSCGVPYIYYATADAVSLIRELLDKERLTVPAVPLLQWSVTDGLFPTNRAAIDNWSLWFGEPHSQAFVRRTQPLSSALSAASAIPDNAAILYLFPHRFLDHASVTILAQLRDSYSEAGATVIFIGPEITLPAEIAPYFLMLSEDSPDDSELCTLVSTNYDSARAQSKNKLPELPQEKASEAARALRSLSRFTAEQTLALSLTCSGLNQETLWARTRKTIEATAGLTFDREGYEFKDLGGMAAIKQFMGDLCTGPHKPDLLVRMDEIEKMLGGHAGDNTGVSQDILGHLLSATQDYGWRGLFLVGVTGGGKSMLTQSVGRQFDIPTLNFDGGSVKRPKVGESEERIRAVTKTLYSLGQRNVFFMLTCNKIDALPPEFRRRFSFGTWFVDLPTADELRTIWAIQLKTHGLDPDPHDLPACQNWTGADVKTCCSLAQALGVSVQQAAAYVVPTAVSDPASIEALRDYANNRLLSVSVSGPYRREQPTEQGKQRIGRAFKA